MKKVHQEWRHGQSIDIASEIGERDDFLVHPKLVQYLLISQKQLEAKKTIFIIANTISIILSLYCLFSLVNIEAYDSFLQYEKLERKAEEFALLYYLSLLDVVHFLRLFNYANGVFLFVLLYIAFFGMSMKSKKIVMVYIFSSSILFLIRSILTLLVIISYAHIKILCKEFFGEENGVGERMAQQYIIIAILMLIVDSILTLICIVQASNSKDQYHQTSTDKLISKKYIDKIRSKYFICYDNALHSYN